MRELSIFVDESGDVGETSDYYLITLVLHAQEGSIEESVRLYELSLRDKGLENVPMHLGPLMNGNDSFKYWDLAERRRLLSSFAVLIDHLPFHYVSLAYAKSEFGGDAPQLMARMKRDLTMKLFDNLGYLQRFDVVKVYYDNGQSIVTEVLHDAIEYVLAKEVIVYRDAKPADYRLLQVADFACGVELGALKYDHHDERPTDRLFFGTRRTFKKNFLGKLRRHRL